MDSQFHAIDQQYRQNMSPPEVESMVTRYRKALIDAPSWIVRHELTMLAHSPRRGNPHYRRALIEHAATLVKD